MAQMAPQMAPSNRFTEYAAASSQSSLEMKQKVLQEQLAVGTAPYIDGADGTTADMTNTWYWY